MGGEAKWSNDEESARIPNELGSMVVSLLFAGRIRCNPGFHKLLGLRYSPFRLPGQNLFAYEQETRSVLEPRQAD